MLGRGSWVSAETGVGESFCHWRVRAPGTSAQLLWVPRGPPALWTRGHNTELSSDGVVRGLLLCAAFFLWCGGNGVAGPPGEDPRSQILSSAPDMRWRVEGEVG